MCGWCGDPTQLVVCLPQLWTWQRVVDSDLVEGSGDTPLEPTFKFKFPLLPVRRGEWERPTQCSTGGRLVRTRMVYSMMPFKLTCSCLSRAVARPNGPHDSLSTKDLIIRNEQGRAGGGGAPPLPPAPQTPSSPMPQPPRPAPLCGCHTGFAKGRALLHQVEPEGPEPVGRAA